MSESKHTPGPWQIGRSADNTPLVMVPVPEREGTGFGVAHINRIPFARSVRGDMDANARLISAAPEMLLALQAMLAGEQYAEQLARAAIAKAEGR